MTCPICGQELGRHSNALKRKCIEAMRQEIQSILTAQSGRPQ